MITLIDGSNMLHRAMYNVEGQVGIHPLRNLYLRFMVSKQDTMIVWDGIGSNTRRRNLYPGYKRMPPKGEDIMASFDIIKEVLIYCPVTQVEIPTWEADDVLYNIAKDYLNQGKNVRIETNDSDFWQLSDHPNIELPLVKPLSFAGRYTPLYKALVGDDADTIPGWRGFGPKRFEAMKDYWDQMILMLQAEDYQAWSELPWPKGIIADYGTFFECATYLRVVTMMDIPDVEFLGNVIIGTSQPARVEQIFDRWKI